MKHLTEEELVERYYGEGADAAGVHLEECAECAASLAMLENELAPMRVADVPERSADYAEQMWARVEAGLPPRPAKPSQVARPTLWRALRFAAAGAVVVAGAFYGGTVYEHWQQHKTQAKVQPAPAAPAQPKVVVVVLGDHLDRSERLLVELKHADAESPEVVNPLRDEAQSLLAANREFRDDAVKEGDPALTLALNHLDSLLTEIANQPGGLDAAGLARIRSEMNADGLLFEVRVLRSKNPHRTKAVRVLARGGAA